MADFIYSKDLKESMARLKSIVVSEVSAPKLAATYARVIDGFVSYCHQSETDWSLLSEAVAKYYEHITKAKAYEKPESTYLRKLARPVFLIRLLLRCL